MVKICTIYDLENIQHIINRLSFDKLFSCCSRWLKRSKIVDQLNNRSGSPSFYHITPTKALERNKLVNTSSQVENIIFSHERTIIPHTPTPVADICKVVPGDNIWKQIDLGSFSGAEGKLASLTSELYIFIRLPVNILWCPSGISYDSAVLPRGRFLN